MVDTIETASAAGVPAETKDSVLDGLNNLLGVFLVDTIAAVVRSDLEVTKAIVRALLPVLEKTIVPLDADGKEFHDENGNVLTFTAVEAGDYVSKTYSEGKQLAKIVATKPNGKMATLIKADYVDINPVDAKNGACYVDADEVELFQSLEAHISALGLSRSRGSRGVYGLARVEVDALKALIS